MTGRGAYEADRASALSGVPESTLYLWAREGLVIPSVSPEKVKLWSWGDLLAARAIYWLRHPGVTEHRPPTRMSQVKELLAFLASAAAEVGAIGDSIADQRIRLFVDRSGVPHVRHRGLWTEGTHGYRQSEHSDLVIDLIAEFQGEHGAVGPDLREPAPFIRIHPGVLSGEPHIEGTRIETRSLAQLARRGFTRRQLAEFYPEISSTQVASAITLERRLTANARRLAA